jgi:small subunit ribosomal protein S12
VPTYNQRCKNLTKSKKHKGSRARALAIDFSPMKRGIIKKCRLMKPKKPNSANRKIANVKLSSGRTVNCYVPGLGHELRDYHVVYVRGGGPKDLNGIQYNLIRGQLDFFWKERKGINRVNKLTAHGQPKLEKRDQYNQ